MKPSKLDAHKKRVHPKGVRTREDRVRIEGRRRVATSSVKLIAVTMVIILICAIAYYVYINYQPDDQGSEVGDKPYNFSLKDQDGFTYTLNDHLKEKPILYGFMSTTCLHCRNTAGSFQDLYDEYGDDVEFVIIISNSDATKQDIKVWASDLGLEFPVLQDTNGDVFMKYDLAYYPSLFIINSKGRIDWKHAGELSASELEQKIIAVE
jgi:peroxiredoxin